MILLTGLTLPHLCDCPKLGPEFPTSYVVMFFMFNEGAVRVGCSVCLDCFVNIVLLILFY